VSPLARSRTASLPPAPTPPNDETTRALLKAAVATAAAKGYRAMTARDLIGATGISSQTFYARFPNKETCFVAAVAFLADNATAQARAVAGDAAATPAARLRLLADGLPRLAAQHPIGTRVLLLESAAGGAAAVAHRDRAADAVVALVGGRPDVARAVLGAAARAALDAILTGTEATLPRTASALATWANGYADLLDAPLPAGATGPSRRRGRAPGSLVPVGPEGTRRLRPGPRSEPRAFVEHSQSDRILDAVATVVAERGLDALTIRTLTPVAEVSSKAFYQHFSSLDEAFAATMLAGGRGALAAALPATMAEADWADGVASGLRALLEFLSEETTFAKVALVDAPAAGAAGAAFQREAIATIAATIAHGYERAGLATIDVVSEAVAAGAWELCADRVRRGAAATLPELAPTLAALALAPVLGAAAALKSARRIAAATAPSGA